MGDVVFIIQITSLLLNITGDIIHAGSFLTVDGGSGGSMGLFLTYVVLYII
jgi:hypothetical protein